MMQSSARLNLSNSSFLLLDDNSQSLDLLMQILTGFRVGRTRTCRAPAEAREHAAIGRYDLIIIDGEMPGEDGISVARYLRSKPDSPNFTAPIMLISAHTPRDKVLRARDAGANIIVKKPIAPAVLLSRIQWLGQRPREFIVSDSYCGPDRRVRNGGPPEGQDERRAAAKALTANGDRDMSQDEVDSLFA